jgi:hypothetical protein
MGRQKYELVTAPARGEIVRPASETQGVGDASNRLVTGVVAHHVVDRLERIEVEDEERERNVVAGGVRQLSFEAALEVMSVEEPGELIGRAARGEVVLPTAEPVTNRGRQSDPDRGEGERDSAEERLSADLGDQHDDPQHGSDERVLPALDH